MLRLLIEKEIREILLSRKFAVTFGVMSILVLLAFYSGAVNYRTSLENYEAAVEDNRRQLDNLTYEFNIAWRVFLKPQALQSVVSGVSNDVGRSTFVTQWMSVSPQYSRFEEEPIFAVFRLLDLEFVITVALSLFAIVFAFDTVSGEKERGTLALLASNSVPRDNVVLGKLFGTFIALGLSMLVPLLIGMAVLPVIGVDFEASDWLRLGIIVLAAGLYLGVFLSLSVLASSLTRRSSHSFLVLLVVWIVTVQIMPRVTGGLAARQIDVVSRIDVFEEDVRLRQTHMQEANDRIRDRSIAGDKDAWKDWESILKELNERDAHLVAALAEKRRNQSQFRNRVAVNLSRFSPVSVFRLVATRMANTSPALDEDFFASAQEFQRVWLDFADQYKPDYSEMSPEAMKKPLDIGQPPAFEQPSRSFERALTDSLPDIGLLAIFNVLLIAGAVLAFRRYDVR